MRQDKIIRAPRNSEHPYMQLIRKIPQDTRMTLEERGFLVYMLSLPASWEANPDHLCRTQGIGEKKLRSIFKKLQTLGYCQVRQIRDSKGKFSHNEYLIFEECIDTPSHNECEPSGNSCRAAETATPFWPDGDQEDNTYTQRRDTREKEHNNTHPTLKKSDAKQSAAVAARVGVNSSSSSPKIIKAAKFPFGSHVRLAQEEHDSLCRSFGASMVTAIIDEMNDYCAASRPKGYADYAAAIRQWVRKRQETTTTSAYKRPPTVDRRTRNMDGTPVDAPHLEGLF